MKRTFSYLITKLGKRSLFLIISIGLLVICYVTIVVMQVTSIEFPSAEDQVESMKPYRAAPFKQLIRKHTALVINGDFKNAKIENGRFEGKLSTDEEGTFNVSRGIAFCVGQPGYFLTAKHCVDGGADIILVPRGRKYRPKDLVKYRAKIIWESSDKDDLVLLQVASRDMVPMRLASELPEPRTPVFSLGYQLAAGKVLDVKPSMRSVGVDGKNPNTFHVESNAPLLKGDSGAPLVNHEGKVVGISINGTTNVNLLQAFCLQGDTPRFKASFLLEEALTRLLEYAATDKQSDTSKL